MNRKVVPVLALVAVIVTVGSARADDRPDPAADEFFESRVRPVLAENCLACHGPKKQKAGLRLDSRADMMKGGDAGPVLVPGDPAGSPLIEAIGYEGDTPMPPKGRLKPAEIAALTEWVRRGASWPAEAAGPRPAAAGAARPDPRGHWAFRPVVDPDVPAVRDAGWPQGPIDRFILAALEAKGLRPVERADRRVLIRRATFDLTGLPPTPAEVNAFLADAAPGAFARVVDRLLASPRYGERWARHWLDVARYGEDQAHSFKPRLYPFGFRYRDWVVSALNNDMPYDRFVTEQVAGDLLDGPESEREGRLAALGFFALGPVYYGNAIADERDDRIDTLCRGVLALTVACARCHDHKFDPISTEDYYALAGVFASTQYREVPTVPPAVVKAYDDAQAAIKKATDALKRAKDRAARKKLQAELDALKKDAPAPYPLLHALADAPRPVNLRVAIRGNPENLGAEAPRRFLTVLSDGTPEPFGAGSGRLELARALVRADNPLTARVMVNRIWEHHFGRGLVGSPSNFGTLGEPPTHPELLDHLAARFVAGGWSIKAVHRAIMLSSAYQSSSRIDPANQQVDADNRLLWRMNRRRLEVESWRDAMLAVSGELDPTLGGPSHDLADRDNRRRTLYAGISRHSLNPLLRLFDFPDPNLTCDRRVVTSVPLQQLFVLNSDFMARQARALARRLTADAGESDAARVDAAYVLLFGREASAEERRWGLEFLGSAAADPSAVAAGKPSTAWEQYAQALLGSNEFTFVD